ncbi:unnamed protein product [Rangifer tarandus platyrhynchus]|uniref:Uncharacterized protein n=1 Tax=Rangifer tarandus platyrhynchus TaxID=3082113 RepID=A0ABN8YW40_RANTA|nr:unnamed protein product [Rangifer tarandus platyrhynchus]
MHKGPSLVGAGGGAGQGLGWTRWPRPGQQEDPAMPARPRHAWSGAHAAQAAEETQSPPQGPPSGACRHRQSPEGWSAAGRAPASASEFAEHRLRRQPRLPSELPGLGQGCWGVHHSRGNGRNHPDEQLEVRSGRLDLVVPGSPRPRHGHHQRSPARPWELGAGG